jgi:tRNA G37 N-methylase Trm5
VPYLVHAKADHVHAYEWNPDAVAALRRNLTLNGVEHRCTVHEGDNRQVCCIIEFVFGGGGKGKGVIVFVCVVRL